jgi:ketopantoate reductase
MLNDFDQSTIANMTAALDFVCKKISADRDSNELRKSIADELMRCARVGRHTLVDLERAGMKVLEETAKPKSSLLGWWRHIVRH